MLHFKAGATLAAVIALMTGACGDTDPASPATAAVAKPQNLYSNGPNTPNVFRLDFENVAFGVGDPKTGLVAWAGLPDDPTQAVDCGGSQTSDPVPAQLAGLKQALNALIVAREINIHVYQNTSLEDTCFEPAIAAGTGHLVYTDNDLAVIGPGAESFGIVLNGIVTSTTGGETMRVQGEVRFVVSPDGSFRVVSSRLSLIPVGGK